MKTRFISEMAIKKAANSLGYTVRHNQNCRGYNNMTTACDLVMRLPGEYDVGFQKQTGGYELVADFWDNHISQYLGDPVAMQKASNQANKLMAEGKYKEAEALLNDSKIVQFTKAYNYFAVQEVAQSQGLQIIENRLEDGSIVLELTGEVF